jgi:flagellar basal body-associated protein FliL
MFSNRRMMVAVVMALNAASIAVALYARHRRQQPPLAVVVAPVAARPHPTVPLDGTLVHLQIGDADATEHHAAVQLDVELENDRAVAAVAARMSSLRESVVAYFSDRTAGELAAPGALARIKDDLRVRLNHVLPAPDIRAVYVTQFIVQ